MILWRCQHGLEQVQLYYRCDSAGARHFRHFDQKIGETRGSFGEIRKSLASLLDGVYDDDQKCSRWRSKLVVKNRVQARFFGSWRRRSDGVMLRSSQHQEPKQQPKTGVAARPRKRQKAQIGSEYLSARLQSRVGSETICAKSHKSVFLTFHTHI